MFGLGLGTATAAERGKQKSNTYLDAARKATSRRFVQREAAALEKEAEQREGQTWAAFTEAIKSVDSENDYFRAWAQVEARCNTIMGNQGSSGR